jgi:cell division protease FtsH
MNQDRFSHIKLADATLADLTDILIKGNGFGHEGVWIKSFFGSSNYAVVEETLSQYQHNTCQYIMDDFFGEKNFKKIGHTYFDEGGELAVIYENLEIDLKQFQKVYKSAFVMYENDKSKICVSINKYSRSEVIYRLYAGTDMTDLLSQWIEYGRIHNVYKGKKIDANCQFLELAAISWDDIILPTEIVSTIRSQVDELFLYGDYLKANGMSLKRGVILAGDPGTGKTLLCKMMSKEVPGTVVYAMPHHLESAGNIRSVCEMAKDLAPCVLIIEDIDWIAENRDDSFNAGAVIELMNYLDGVQEFNDIITLATTNNVDKIEAAVKNRPGRFDRVFTIPKPNKSCRDRMIRSFMNKFIVGDDFDYANVVQNTDDLSGAHIHEICKTAALYAIRNKSVDENKKAIVSNKHMELSLDEVKNVNYSSFHKAQSKRKLAGFNRDFE